MGLSIVCSKCARGLTNGDATYCGDCYYELIKKIRRLEKIIRELGGKT